MRILGYGRASLRLPALLVMLATIISLRFFSPQPSLSSDSTLATKEKASPEIDCSKLFLYLPHDVSNNGICSQLQNYMLAVHVAASFQRTLVVWDPLFEQDHTKSPLFGCSPDYLDSAQHPLSTGLSQILEIPSSRNHVCSSSLCPFNHSEWTRLVSSSANEFPIATCDTVSAMVSGGKKLRRQYLQRLHQTPQQTNFTRWVTYVGGVTPTEMEWFQQQPEDPWKGVAALVAQHIQWQPFLQPTIASQLQAFQLPRVYTAMHIRRGDKLKREATSMVRKYWASRGESETDHPNYIPLEAYVAQLNPSIDPPHVFIATDDPATIRSEIQQLVAVDDDYSYWTFHLLADHRVQSGHMNTEPDCHVRYNMTIEAIVDLEVMIRAQCVCWRIEFELGAIYS